MTTLKVRGERVDTRPTSREFFEGQLKITQLDEVRPGTARDAAAQPVAVECDGANDVLEVELDGGIQLWTTVERFQQDFPQEENRSVSGPTSDLPVSLRLPAAERGVGDWLVKAYRFLKVEDRLAGRVALQAAEWLERQVLDQPGLRRLDLATESGLDRLPAVGSDDLDAAKPILLLLHGTASSTRGSFCGLWEKPREGVRKSLRQEYGANTTAYEHRTLTQSPIQNALELARTLPENARLHVVSHSRGGLVGELLCRGTGTVSSEAFGTEDIAIFEDPAQQRLLRELNDTLNTKRLRVERFVRVACPARGTTLASKRLDLYFSVLTNLTRFALPAGIVARGLESLIGFAATVAKHRTRPDELPGLAAMMPSSDLIRMLNRPGVSVDSDLTVLAGDAQARGIWRRLGLLLMDLFYLEDHDFVVNTKAMYGGARRDSNRGRFFFDEGPEVNHFSYFRNHDTTRRLLSGLTQAPGFEASFDNLTTAPRELRLPVRRGDEPPRPTVFVLPGIMGSQLGVASGGRIDLVWLDILDLAWGGLPKKLGITSPSVVAQAPLPRSYGDLLEFLHQTHDVAPFGYDWRKSLRSEAARLAGEIEARLDAASAHGLPISIIAHSMGGLLARAFMRYHEPLWRRLCEHPDARVVLLGTPTRGSHAITRLLCAQEPTLRSLALLDLRHSQKQLLQTIANFPGVLELLPDDDDFRFFEPTTWTEIASAAGRDFVAPRNTALRNALALRKELNETPLDPERVLYVAGCADRTPIRLEIVKRAKREERVEFHATSEGDGRVPWETGIPPEFTAYYASAIHGDLADDPPMFPALLDLLRTGRTNRLPTQKPARARGPADVRVLRPEEAPYLPDENALEALALGGSTRRRRRESIPGISVFVTHGDLRDAQTPVMVGHYAGDTIVSAEAALDRLLGGRLSGRHELGLYPGAIGQAEAFLEATEKAPGAVVLGLGPVGELQRGDLPDAVAAGLLRYAAAQAGPSESAKSDSLLELEVGTLLIGTGAGGLSVADSILAILRGAAQASATLRQSRYANDFRIVSLNLIELYEDRAIEAAHHLNRLTALPEFAGEFAAEPRLRSGGRGQRRVRFEEAPGWWGRLQVTGERDGTLKFVTLTDRARAPVTLQAVQRPLIDQFVEEAITNVNTDASLCQTLFDLLLPLELKARAPDQEDVVLIVDDESARYPWELMSDRRARSEKPLVVERGLLRQLQTQQYRQGLRNASTGDVLVVGDPVSQFPDLPGAQREAEEIAGLLKTGASGGRGFNVVARIRSEASEIVRELFARDYRILHLAGHGVFEYPVEVKLRPQGQCPRESIETLVSGMVLGDDVFLTPAEVEQMREVPELVFLNCCHLGRIQPGDRENAHYSPHRLAANLAAQFIRMGVRAVVAAGWAVNDHAALTFAGRFYRGLLSGRPFGEAVRAARSETWDRHPGVNTWGAYQCYGDPDYRLARDQSSGGAVQPPPLVSAAEVIVELQNAGPQSSLPENRPWIASRLEDFEGSANHPDWAHNAQLQAALGVACHALGHYEKAVVRLRCALKIEKARVELEAVQTLANAEVRLAAERLDQEGGDRAGGQVPDSPLELIQAAIDRLNHLVGLAPTSERYNLLAGAQKRRSQLTAQSAERKVALEAMSAAYQNANDLFLAREGKDSYYSLLNALAAQVAAAWQGRKRSGKPPKTLSLADLEEKLGTAKAVAEIQEREDPSFWNRAVSGDSELLRLAVGAKGSSVERVVSAYRDAARRGCTPGEWKTLVEHAAFLAEMAKASASTQLQKNLERVCHRLRKEGR